MDTTSAQFTEPNEPDEPDTSDSEPDESDASDASDAEPDRYAAVYDMRRRARIPNFTPPANRCVLAEIPVHCGDACEGRLMVDNCGGCDLVLGQRRWLFVRTNYDPITAPAARASCDVMTALMLRARPCMRIMPGWLSPVRQHVGADVRGTYTCDGEGACSNQSALACADSEHAKFARYLYFNHWSPDRRVDQCHAQTPSSLLGFLGADTFLDADAGFDAALTSAQRRHVDRARCAAVRDFISAGLQSACGVSLESLENWIRELSSHPDAPPPYVASRPTRRDDPAPAYTPAGRPRRAARPRTACADRSPERAATRVMHFFMMRSRDQPDDMWGDDPALGVDPVLDVDTALDADGCG